MRINFINGRSLELPDGAVFEKPNWSTETPYIEKFMYRVREEKGFIENVVGLKLHCLDNLRRMIGDYESYYEPLAGIGITGKLFERSPIGTWLNEMDDSCRRILLNNFNGPNVTGDNAFLEFRREPADVVFLDFNDYTMKKMARHFEMVKAAFSIARKAVIINDCSVFYLRYGMRSLEVYRKFFGCERLENKVIFFQESKRWYEGQFAGWYVSAVEFNRETAFLLFRREPCDEPSIQERSSKNMDRKTIEVQA